MKCIFCFNALNEEEAISTQDRLDEDTNLIVADLIRQHFIFAEKILQDDEGKLICQNCFAKIDNFHDFFNTVSNFYEHTKAEEDEEDDNGEFEVEDDDCKLDNDIIVYELSEKDEKELIEEEVHVIKEEEEINNLCEETMSYETEIEWIGDENETLTYIEPKQKSIYSNDTSADTADDQRIKETANMFCEICDKQLISLRDAKSHYKQYHLVEGYLICCNRKFRQRCRLIEHVNTHFQITYPCIVCGKTFDSKAYLTKHMACHETVKQYKCAHCPKFFAKKFQVRNHLLSVHLFDNIEPELECPIENCFKKFKNQARLKHHVDYTHSPNHFEICEICSKIFKTKNAIEEHKKTHMRKSSDRIKCEICGHFLSDLKSYNRHVRNHATESLENFCNYCGKKSPNLNALKKHIRYVHEMEKNFHCRYCEKSFKRQRNLIDHEASVHTLQDLYSCSFCSKTFRNQSNMLSHRKKQHPSQYLKPSYMRDQLE